MPVSKILQRELTSAQNAPHNLFTGEPDIEDLYLRDRLGGDYRRLALVERDLHVQSCLERRAQAITARDRKITPASGYEGDVHASTLAQWLVDNSEWDDLEKKLWQGAYINGRSHAEIIWSTIETPRGLTEPEVSETGEVLRPAYPYPQITIPVDFRLRLPSRFKFMPPDSSKVRRIKDPSGLLDRSIKLPVQRVKGYELRYLTDKDWLNGIPAEVFKFICHSYGSQTSNPNGKGVGGDLYWPVTLKKEFLSFWVVYGDKYAEPGKLGTYPEETGDPSLLEDFFEHYGRDSWGALPEGYKVNLLEAQRSGTVNTYESFLRWLDGQVSELIVGQAYGVHVRQGFSGQPAENDENIRKEWVKADADLLAPVMRKFVLRPLTVLNLPDAEPPNYWRDFDDQENLNSRSERDDRLYAQGYRLRPEAVKRIYGDDYEDTGNPAVPPEVPPTPVAAPEPSPPPQGEGTEIVEAAEGGGANPLPLGAWPAYQHWLEHQAPSSGAGALDFAAEPSASYEALQGNISQAMTRAFQDTWASLESATGYTTDTLAKAADSEVMNDAARLLGQSLDLNLSALDALGRYQAVAGYLPSRLADAAGDLIEALTGTDPETLLAAAEELPALEFEGMRGAYDYGEELARLTLYGLLAWTERYGQELTPNPEESPTEAQQRAIERVRQGGWLPSDDASGDAPASRASFSAMTLAWGTLQAGHTAIMSARDVVKLYPFSEYEHLTATSEARRHHMVLDGMILRSDHAFWVQYSPPNGFGCNCRIRYHQEIPEGKTLSDPPAQTMMLKGVPVLALSVSGALLPLVDSPDWLGMPTIDNNRKAALKSLEERLPDWLRDEL